MKQKAIRIIAILVLCLVAASVILQKRPYQWNRLRSKPLTVGDNMYDAFNLTVGHRPYTYIKNDYEAKTLNQDKVVIDHVTGLMWQQASSSNYRSYTGAQKYVKRLNRNRFAGFDDWRLPTIPELMSLIESEKKDTGLYIDPIFDATQSCCLSADKLPSDKHLWGGAWIVDFSRGKVNWNGLVCKAHVRVVRSLK